MLVSDSEKQGTQPCAVAGRAQHDYVSLVSRLGGRNLPPGGEAALTEIIDVLPEMCRTIVDIGCNTGWVTSKLAGARPEALVTGIDIEPRMCAAAVQRTQRLSPDVRNAQFTCLDVTALPSRFTALDAVVCAGSAAFFPDVTRAYDAVRRSLSAQGVFIDVNYLYERGVPIDLRETERREFGITSPPRSAARVVFRYEQAHLTLRSLTRLSRFQLQDSPQSAFYRSLIGQIPDVSELAREMLARRDLIRRLSAFRHPVIATADRGCAPIPAKRSAADVMRVAQIMDAFSTPFPACSMERLQRLPPYYFLAYVGDPDSAPGGAASVKRAAGLLRSLGLPSDAAILDIGSFTGLSTFVLGTEFDDVLGIDIEPEFVRVARCLGSNLGSSVRFDVRDARCTGFTDQSFSAIVMTATLGYTDTPGKLIREAFRLLRPDGVLIEFLYHYPSRTPVIRESVQAAVSEHIMVSSLSRQIARIEQAGFRLERAIRLPREAPDPAWIDAVADAAIDRERRRQPLSDVDASIFVEMFRRYVGRVRIPAEPSVYLCAFRRPGPGW